MKKIVFTGGGSAGHVTPNLAIIPQLQAKGWEVEYIGSRNGIEREIIEQAELPYHGISTGKLRRYFAVENFKDPFRVMKGLWESIFILRKLKPDLVFSKGGFVAVPVVLASWVNRIPIIIHESDMTPGLANRISIPFATRVCVTFPETIQHFGSEKAVHTGTPIRPQLFQGSVIRGRMLCDFVSTRPVLLVTGGSLGSEVLNRLVRTQLDELLKTFQIVHLCGKGKLDPALGNRMGYRQFEYLNEQLPDVLAMADVVVSRAGSNIIYELLALKKPQLLVPLPITSSRGDQIANARSFEKSGFSRVVEEEELTPDRLVEEVRHLYRDRERYKERMADSPLQNSVGQIVDLIEKVSFNPSN
jgi:UDP-N-acetylglucosamine--N-acetylmuramyl-(pentapeptide) pyrophosphoryl-undecaprenol N-acetylglucosamine transferase